MKILILTSRYLPNPSANGISTKYIVDELKRRSHEVTLISVKGEKDNSYDIIENIPIYRIEPSFYSKILNKELKLRKNSISRLLFIPFHILRKIKLAINIFSFPNFDKRQSKKVYNKLKELYEKDNYDCIISIFKPYWNIAALKEFKKNYPNVICIGYYLDLINSLQKPKFMPSKLYDWLCYNEDCNTFTLLDMVLVAKKGRELYSDSKYDYVRNKIKFVDFPTFILPVNKDKKQEKRKLDKLKTIITFAGTLNSKYRNPELLLRILDKASCQIGKIELNIYGVNDCNKLFLKYNHNPNFIIKNHGFKDHDVVIRAMSESDILLNVSNTIQNAVPSKIFEMFSLGKPIINLVFNKQDSSLEYFKRYPAVVNIEEWNSFDRNLNEVINFFISKKNMKGEL